MYNVKRMSERCHLHLRLTLGCCTSWFFCAPTSRNKHYIHTLERRIFELLQHFRRACAEAEAEAIRLRSHSGTSTSTSTSSTLGIRIPSGSSHEFWVPTQRRSNVVSALQHLERDGQLYASYHYCTDEIVFFGLKKQVGGFAFYLAELLFGTLLRHPIFSIVLLPDPPASLGLEDRLLPLKRQFVTRWVGRLVYVIDHFPAKGAVQALRDLYHSIYHPATSLLRTPSM